MRPAIRTALSALALVMAFGVANAEAQQKTKGSASSLGLTDRLWVENKPANGLPGVMIAFLSDGTLLQDSCWETYTVSKWKQTSPKTLSWDENGTKIDADITSLTKNTLVLKLGAGRDRTEHSYSPVKAPYLCPDMKK